MEQKKAWEPLNKAETEALFSSLSVMIGGADVVPLHDAIQATSADAVYHVVRNYGFGTRDRFCSSYGIGDPNPSVWYLTHEGFIYAVTWENTKALVHTAREPFETIVRPAWEEHDRWLERDERERKRELRKKTKKEAAQA